MNTLVKRLIGVGAGFVLLGGGVAYAMYPDGVDVLEVKKLDISSSIDTVGTIEADECITVYAPVSGRLSSVRCKINQKITKGALLATFDQASFEDDLKKATLNQEYHKDGYNAALAENKKNKSKAASASASSDALKSQYISTQENRDDLNIAQNSKSNNIKATIQGIEGALDNMQTNMEIESAKLEAASGAFNEVYAKLMESEADLAGKTLQLNGINSQIEANANAYEAIKDDPSKAEEAEQLLEANQKLSESMTELQNNITASGAQYEILRGAALSAGSEKDSAAGSVNSLKNEITSSRDALASLPVDSMDTKDYARYLELTRQLDIIEKEWTKASSQKSAAEEKIVSDYQIRQYEDSMEIAQIDADKAQKNLEKSKEGIKSTAAGTVLTRLVDEGAMVNAGDALFTIQPDSGYKVSVMVSKYDIGSVEIGQSAEVSVSGRTYPAKVAAIAPIATNDSSGKPRVKVELSFDDKDVKPTIGLEAEVKINTGESRDVLGITEKAVYTDDAGSYVYILSKGKAERKNIETGLRGNGYCQIEDGLSEGEKVITSPITEDDIGTRFVEN